MNNKDIKEKKKRKYQLTSKTMKFTQIFLPFSQVLIQTVRYTQHFFIAFNKADTKLFLKSDAIIKQLDLIFFTFLF